MRILIHPDDLKRLYTGAALSVVLGLTLGAVVQPSLADGILAPQQDWGSGGQRSHAVGAAYSLADYGGQVPDYVIGTNYTQQPQLTALPSPSGDDQAEAAYDVIEYARTAEAVVPSRWEDEPYDAPVYPSTDGGAWNPSDLPEPPEPPVDEFEPT